MKKQNAVAKTTKAATAVATVVAAPATPEVKVMTQVEATKAAQLIFGPNARAYVREDGKKAIGVLATTYTAKKVSDLKQWSNMTAEGLVIRWGTGKGETFEQALKFADNKRARKAHESGIAAKKEEAAKPAVTTTTPVETKPAVTVKTVAAKPAKTTKKKAA